MGHIWAASWQNQQNSMCAHRRLRSAWVSTQSDQSLQMPRLIWVFTRRTCQFVGFVMMQLICLESLMGCAVYWGRGRATKSYKTWGAQIGTDSSVSKMVCFMTSYYTAAMWVWVALAMNIQRYVSTDNSRFPGLRWFHRVFPSYMVETYIGFPPSQDRPGRPLVILTLWSVLHS